MNFISHILDSCGVLTKFNFTHKLSLYPYSMNDSFQMLDVVSDQQVVRFKASIAIMEYPSSPHPPTCSYP